MFPDACRYPEASFQGGRDEGDSRRATVGEGNEDEFVRRWTQFLRRSKAEAPGLIEGNGSETRRTRATSSFSEWTDEASRTNRRILDDFQSHPEAAGCVCDAFSHDYELATEVK